MLTLFVRHEKMNNETQTPDTQPLIPNILLVDDDRSILRSISPFLESNGYHVTTSETGEYATELLKKRVFDLIITDLVMGKVDGFQVLKGAKKQNRDTMVIILTGYSDINLTIDALRIGADDYLLKPCEPEVMLFRVKHCLEKKDTKEKIKEVETALTDSEPLDITSLSGHEEEIVYIVSPLTLQNTLISSYLEKALGIQCAAVKDGSGIPPHDEKVSEEKRLVLWDAMGKDLKTCFSNISENKQIKQNREPICIFNLHGSEHMEEEDLAYGVKGLFYLEDPIAQLVKGIQAIFEGELWLPRRMMTRYIVKNQRQHFPADECADKHLTHREIEILTMIAHGASNSMIAENLYISPHTVKTHIYNIFKKIEVPNRLQAAFWAIKNI